MHRLELPVSKGVPYISVIVADYEIAAALSLNISSPLLYLETTIFSEGEKPVEFTQTFYRSDQFKYTLRLI
jgi:DNA-binding GntR family transcriptional regulator